MALGQHVPLQHHRIRLPRLDHAQIKSGASFSFWNLPIGFMHADNYSISMLRPNAEHYLTHPDELLTDLSYAIDLSHRISEGTVKWHSPVHHPPLLYHLHAGKLLPMSTAPWEKVPDTKEDYLTLHAVNFLQGHESVGIRHYIALDEHERLMEESSVSITKLIADQVERGVTSGVERAIAKTTRTLEATQDAKADVERQMKELQYKLDKLNEAEQRHLDRQRLLQEQAALRAAEQAERERQKAERAATRTRAGYVYILKQVNGEYYKIGRTSKPDDRLHTFNVKLPFTVEYEHLIQTDDMYALESELHAKYADKRVNGSEFFRLTTQDILDIVAESETP